MVAYGLWMLIVGTGTQRSQQDGPGWLEAGVRAVGRLLSRLVVPGRHREAVHAFQAGKAALDRLDFDLALCCFSEAIGIDQGFAAGHYGRGFVYLQKGDCERANADFSEAIRLLPDHADSYYLRGLCFELRGEREQAWVDRATALRLDPRVEERVEGRW